MIIRALKLGCTHAAQCYNILLVQLQHHLGTCWSVQAWYSIVALMIFTTILMISAQSVDAPDVVALLYDAHLHQQAFL